MPTERAVSSVLGYVLIFAIVLLSITATFTLGLGALTDARDGSVQENSRRSMQSLSTTIEAVRETNTTVRDIRLRTGPGTVESGDQTRLTVSIDGSQTLQTTFRPIRYRYEDQQIVYEAGGLLQTTGDSGVLLERPPFVFEDDTVLVTPTTTTPIQRGSTNARTVTTVIRRATVRQATLLTGSHTVDVTIETQPRRAAIWERTLLEMLPPSGTCSRTGATVNCEFTPSDSDATILVREFRVSYAFSS